MDEKELAVYLSRMARKIPEICQRAARETAEDLLEEARRMSSGTYSLRLLRQMGHPYAKRHVLNRKWGARRKSAPGIPYGDPAIINEQTGAFKRAWKIVPPTIEANQVSVGLVNDDRKAVWIRDGTDNKRGSGMIKRPIKARLERMGQRLWREKLARAVDEAIQKS